MFTKTWPFRRVTAVPYFLTLIGLHLLWCLFAIGILASPDLEIKVFLARYKYIVLTLIVPSTFLFITNMFRPQFWAQRPLLLKIFYAVPLILCLLSFLPQTRELFVHSLSIISLFGGESVRWIDGPLFKVHFALSSLLMISGYFTMVWVIANDPPEKKRQAVIMLLGVTALVVIDIVTVTYDLPIRWLNHGALLCLPLLLSYAYCVFKFDLINILPLAKTNLFEQLPAPVYVVETSGRIIAMNGFAKLHILTASIEKFLGTMDLPKVSLQSNEEILFTHFTETEKKYQVKVNPLRNQYGKVIGYTLVLMDITAIQESNERLNELILLKNKVFSVLAHDVSSNLAGIELLIDVTDLHLKKNSYENIPDNVSQLKSGVKSAKSVLADLLTWVKKEDHGAMDQLLVSSVIQLAINDTFTASQAKNISWSIDIEALKDLSAVQNKEMLRSTIRNILTNAIKFSPINGKIEVLGLMDQNSWSLQIKDQGPGMSPANIIFVNEGRTPLKSENPSTDGFGIGLSVVQDFLRNNNGTLFATNTHPGLIMTLQFKRSSK